VPIISQGQDCFRRLAFDDELNIFHDYTSKMLLGQFLPQCGEYHKGCVDLVECHFPTALHDDRLSFELIGWLVVGEYGSGPSELDAVFFHWRGLLRNVNALSIASYEKKCS
jgi:hypothetical protein